MTTTATTRTPVAVGQTLASREEIEAVPIGAVVRGGATDYTRIEGGYARSGETRLTNRVDQMSVDYNVVVSLPEPPAPAGPVVGAVLTADQVSALPAGSKVRNTVSGFEWTKQEGGNWTNHEGTSASDTRIRGRASRGNVTLVEAAGIPSSDSEPPDPADLEQTPEGPTVSVDRYKQRLATMLLGVHQHVGMGHQDIVRDAIAAWEVPTEPMVGLAVSTTDLSLLTRLPRNTVLVTEGEPEDTHYGVYRVDSSGRITHLLGTRANIHPTTVLIVESIPGIDTRAPWLDSSDSEVAEVMAFRAVAWKTVMNVKAQTGWCSELESWAGRCGVTRVDENTTPGDLLTAEQVAELPERTLVRFISATSVLENSTFNSGTALYVRDDAANNPAKTRRIGGALPGGWAARGMEVCWRPDTSPLLVHPASHAEMDVMPIGTAVTQGGGTARYVKEQSIPGGRNWVRPDYGSYNSAAFSLNSYVYSTIPGVNA